MCTVSLEDTLVHIVVSKICVLALLAIIVGEICNSVRPSPVVSKGYIQVQMYAEMNFCLYLVLLATSDELKMIRIDAA